MSRRLKPLRFMSGPEKITNVRYGKFTSYLIWILRLSGIFLISQHAKNAGSFDYFPDKNTRTTDAAKLPIPPQMT